MPEEFEGDLTESVFWGADLSRARFRDVNLTDVSISHALVVNLDIDSYIDNVTINGVDVTSYVNEHDPWYPLRALVRPRDPEGARAGWAALELTWATTIERARRLSDAQLHEKVNGEFSFIETLRHLVMAMDKWFTVPIGGGTFAPIGVPNTGSLDFPWPGLNYTLDPSLSDVLAVRADRGARFGAFLADLVADDLTREVDVLENGRVTVNDCVLTVLEEEFWHHRYAVRDLATVESAAG
jgi:hypothetical protein